MSAAATQRVDLPVSGMTCAACARSIERTLARTGGVSRANVNFATSTATVEFDAAHAQVGDFVNAIEDLGYGVPADAGLGAGASAGADEPEQRWRLAVALVCAAPLLWLGMAHGPAWIQLFLALPVVGYAGAPFYAGAWSGLRHRSANMNTLIALGTGAAFLYSVYETLRGGQEVYFEAAAVIIALILVGRTLEGRARRRASAGHSRADGSAASRGAGRAHWRGGGNARGAGAARRPAGGAAGRAHRCRWRGTGRRVGGG